MSSPQPDFQYDPYSLEAMSDPLPLYRTLRRDWPVYPLPHYHSWAVSRFEDIWTVFRDRERFTDCEGQVFPKEQLEAPLPASLPCEGLKPLAIFNNLDPPLHTKVRRALHAALLPSAVAALERMLREAIRERLDLLAESGCIDVNRDFASYVSAAAACHIVGLPQSDIPEVIVLVNKAMSREPGQSGMSQAGWAAVGELKARLTALAAQRRKGPIAGDVRMIDGLAALMLDGRGPLEDDEIAQQMISILIGGTESLPKVIAGGLLALWEHPDQKRAVASDPRAHAALAFEEMVRYCAPAQWFGRTAKADTEIAGQKICRGERLLLLTGSANRDEREFDAPDEFRWNRKMARVVAFGMGPHTCIGINIARLEGRLLLEELLLRYPDYELDVSRGERAISEFQIGWVRLPMMANKRRA